MTVLAIILTAMTSVVLLIWTSRHLLIHRERRHGFLLSEDYHSQAKLPFVSVVVAAKDEADNIARCVNTMLGQDYADFEVIVVNDRSSDDTGPIVERLAAEHERLRLINVEHLPAGWCGKNHAMKVGIAESQGDWICMIDADCQQTSTGSLRAAIAYAIDTGADLLSVLPNLEMKGFWENVVQPVCSGVMMIWFSPEKVNDPDRPHAYANGAFMLMRRSAYDAIGGHEAVKDRVNEDMHIAARVKGEGLKLRVTRNRGLYLVRMYTSLRGIVRGWSRIFYGTFGTFRRLSISLLVLLMMGLLPYAAGVVGLAGMAAEGTAGAPMVVCAAVAAATVVMQISVIWRFYRMIHAVPALAWTYPVGCGVGLVALAIALSKMRTGAQVTWRNTTYIHPDQ